MYIVCTQLLEVVLISVRIFLLSMGVLLGKLKCLLFLLQYEGMVIVSSLDKTACLIPEAVLRLGFGIQNPLYKLSQQRTTKVLIRTRIRAV